MLRRLVLGIRSTPRGQHGFSIALSPKCETELLTVLDSRLIRVVWS